MKKTITFPDGRTQSTLVNDLREAVMFTTFGTFVNKAGTDIWQWVADHSVIIIHEGA